MTKLLRVLLFVWVVVFFPVSCTFFGAVGALVCSEIDARNVDKGEEPHASLFYVVARIKMDGEEYYKFKSLYQLERIHATLDKYTLKHVFDYNGYTHANSPNCYQAKNNSATTDQPSNSSGRQPDYEYTFLLPDLKRESSTDSGYYRYEVERLSDKRQLIEVYFAEEDYKSTSRYIAEAHSVTPVYSKILEPGYAFISLPFAFVLSCVLMFVGRHYRKKWLPFDPPKNRTVQTGREMRHQKLRSLQDYCPYCKFNLRSGKNKCDECGKEFTAVASPKPESGNA